MAKPVEYVRHGTSHAWALHSLHPAFDLHADPLMWSRWVGYDFTKPHSQPAKGKYNRTRHTDIPRLRIGGVGAQFFGLVSLPVLSNADCFRAIDEQIDILERTAATSDELLAVCRSHDDVLDANGHGAIAGLLGIEGAHALEGRLENLDHFARRGVRYLGLSHFSANEACFPCVGRGRDDSRGLTTFGRELVERCFANGVIVDLAHINKRGFLEVCAMARRAGVPVIDSHTGVLGSHAHLRNIDDEQLRALADTGGVAGVIFARAYLGGTGDVWSVVDHLSHMVSVMGHEHIALGSDFDGMVVPVDGLGDASMLPNLTDALLVKGWSDEVIARLLRSNAMRTLRDASAVYAGKRPQWSPDAGKWF